MKTGTWTTLIFLISVTFAPIIADEDSKLTSKSILPSVENPSLSIVRRGNSLRSLAKDLTKLPQSNGEDALTVPSPSTIETVVNSDISSEYLKNLAILKKDIDCNLLNLIPDAIPLNPVNLKTLICQTIALTDYLQNGSVDLTLKLDNALQALLTGILQTIVRILRNAELGINGFLEIPENQTGYPALRAVLDPVQFDNIVRSSRNVEALLAPRILRDVVNETWYILSSQPLKSLNGVLLDCNGSSNDTAEDIRDILDGKLTYCGLNWAIRALKPAVNEAYERSRRPVPLVPPYVGDSVPNLPVPTIPLPWPANLAPWPLNPVPFPLNTSPYPANPTPLPENPTESSVAFPPDTAFNADADTMNRIAADLASLAKNFGALLAGKPGSDVSVDSDVNSAEYTD